MTWYADEILTTATPRAIAWVTSSPFVSHAYVVRSLSDHPWHTDEIKHDLSPSGLLFIQPVCGQDSASRDWYRLQPLSWDAFSTPHSTPSHSSEVSQRLLDYLDEGEIPPPDFRSYLATMARHLEQAVVFYSCGMWGGSIEYELSLVYAPEERLFTSKSALSSGRLGSDEDALPPALETLGVRLPTGYFAPHTRSFPWSAHRLTQRGLT